MSFDDPMRDVPVAECRSCSAPIVWVYTDDRKAMPVDAKPERRLVPTGSTRDGKPRMRVRATYVSHFATCPDADRWRKDRH